MEVWLLTRSVRTALSGENARLAVRHNARLILWKAYPANALRYHVVSIHPQYIVDEKQDRQAVLLPMAEWEAVIEELEELDDIRAYDEAKSDSEESLDFEQAIREIHEGCGE
jgi:PHD/YefM family antitoxin component YafN of YafNO toxin-antitoxin module